MVPGQWCTECNVSAREHDDYYCRYCREDFDNGQLTDNLIAQRWMRADDTLYGLNHG